GELPGLQGAARDGAGTDRAAGGAAAGAAVGPDDRDGAGSPSGGRGPGGQRHAPAPRPREPGAARRAPLVSERECDAGRAAPVDRAAGAGAVAAPGDPADGGRQVGAAAATAAGPRPPTDDTRAQAPQKAGEVGPC